jgi:uroporphyrinogen decarboxylase
VCGGIRRDTLTLGTAQAVRKEAKAALATNGSRSLILSTGCVVPIIAPDGNIQTVRDAVDFA